jgi:hypothetical protein
MEVEWEDDSSGSATKDGKHLIIVTMDGLFYIESDDSGKTFKSRRSAKKYIERNYYMNTFRDILLLGPCKYKGGIHSVRTVSPVSHRDVLPKEMEIELYACSHRWNKNHFCCFDCPRIKDIKE